MLDPQEVGGLHVFEFSVEATEAKEAADAKEAKAKADGKAAPEIETEAEWKVSSTLHGGHLRKRFHDWVMCCFGNMMWDV